ncbi:mitosis inhibitor protein kinase swe1 [Coemansia sp. Benny D115]|nr:mitosis inhibitor protein kinase swe1 [Coemansia sp. Benny D115]
MANKPHRPTTRSLRKSLATKNDQPQVTPPAHPLTRSRRKAMTTLRPCTSFPSLPPEPPVFERPSPQRLRMRGRRSQGSGASMLVSPSPLVFNEDDSPTHTPKSYKRQSMQGGRIAGDRQFSLLGCITPKARGSDGSCGMDSPINLHSLSPSPCESPYISARIVHRRLTFSQADIAAAQATAGTSVAGSGGSSAPASAGPHQPATMFTPPATKLVRPDPSAFVSTGLQSRKQLVRARRNSSFITPETPCKRAGAAGAVATRSKKAAEKTGQEEEEETEGMMTGMMVTPVGSRDAEDSLMHSVMRSSHYAPEPDLFRLGKHRNSSSASLRRTRKKAHLGPADDVDDMMSLFDTPCRPRQNTLVDDDFMHRPPPGFRIPMLADGSPIGTSPLSSSPSAAGLFIGRPLPPSFAPQHQQVMDSLVADNIFDPHSLNWDLQPSSSSNRWSCATVSDACSESSAATLTSSAASTASGSKEKVGKLRSQHLKHMASRSALARSMSDETVLGSMALKGKGVSLVNTNIPLFGVGGRSISNLHDEEMELDAGTEDENDSDDCVKGDLGDDCDVFGDINAEHRSGSSLDQRVIHSPRIMAVERPQMPQIVQGCATNYAHLLGREYFARKDTSLPFLAPKGDFYVDGLGYLDYFAHQFEILGRAGEGNFSTVYSTRSLVDGQVYAVKKTRQPFNGRQERARRLREVDILWTVPHRPGIVRLFNAWEQFGHLYMQFEMCEQGSLSDFLDRRAEGDERLPEARAWAILAHAAHAVNRLHDSDIAHLDIKPSNFLLGPHFGTPGGEQHEGWLKLADFGHAVRLPHEPLAWVEEGDREYMAPEVLRGVYTKAADVFSLGMMMLEITADIVLPDNGIEWHKLRESCFDDPVFDNLPYSPDLLETIKQMLLPDPDQRPSLSMVLAMSQCTLYTSASGAASPSGVVSDDGEDFTHLRPRSSRPIQYNPRALVRAATADADSFHPHHHHHHSTHRMTTRSAAAAAAAAAAATTKTAAGGSSSAPAAAFAPLSASPTPPPPPPLTHSSASALASLSSLAPHHHFPSKLRLPGRRGLARRTASAPGPAPPGISASHSSPASPASALPAALYTA